jgi:hypothetical protein
VRSENPLEEGVNGLCLLAELSVSLRSESSLQVSTHAVLFAERLMRNIDRIRLPLFSSFHARYFIYGMQDAQNLERVKLEFSIFDIPKGEHKPKSE